MSLGIGLLTFFVLVASSLTRGQCQPTNVAANAKQSTSNASSTSPQFYDEPSFTVAGVADTTNLGGHGSDTVVRTKEALAKDAVALSTNTARNEESEVKIRALLSGSDLDLHSQAELHHQLGDLEEKRNNSLEAVREYQRAAELDSKESYLFDWGVELLAHRAPEAACEVFVKGTRLFPRSARMLIGLGVSWHARGDYTRAIACLSEASDLNPGDPNAYIFLGKMVNSETAQSKDLTVRLARFARLQPENALANFYYAIVLSKAKADPESVTKQRSLLEKAIRLDPKFGLAYLQLGIMDSEKKEFSKAIEAYQRAIAVNPEMEEAHYRLAQTYRLTGEKNKAQQELRVYEELSKKTQEKTERERHEVQQFVISLRDSGAGDHVPPK